MDTDDEFIKGVRNLFVPFKLVLSFLRAHMAAFSNQSFALVEMTESTFF
jgi:hypothetical protein